MPSRSLFDRWLRPKPLGPQGVEAVLLEDDDCTELVAAVGESNYQQALASACGSHRWVDVSYDCIAALWPEPDNPHDPQAIQVLVNGKLVAYLAPGRGLLPA